MAGCGFRARGAVTSIRPLVERNSCNEVAAERWLSSAAYTLRWTWTSRPSLSLASTARLVRPNSSKLGQ
jgi:hypothetical protein